MYLCRSDCICVNIGRQPYTNIPMKRIYLLLLVATIGTGAWGATTKNLSLKYHTFTFRGSSSYRMWTYNMPEVHWSTSDSTVAVVDQYGLIRPIRPGETTIAVETADGSQRDTCRVIVEYGAFSHITSPTLLKDGKWTLIYHDGAPYTLQQRPTGTTVWLLHKDSVYTFESQCGYLAATTNNGKLDTVVRRQSNTKWDIMPYSDKNLSVSVHNRKTRGDVLCYDTDNHRFNTLPHSQASHNVAVYQEAGTFLLEVSSADTMGGYINGASGHYEKGTQVHIQAFPKENYHFIHWNDGNRDNPRVVTVATSNISRIAYFSPYEGSCGEHLQWRYSQDTLYITGYGAMDNYTINGGAPWKILRKYITYIQFPEGLTKIGDYAFYYCTKVEHIDIPSTVTHIGNSTFRECSGLKSIIIPDNVTQIGSSSFSACTALRDIVLSKRLHAINTYTFNECSALTHIDIPDSVETIDKSAFVRCTSLSEVIMGSGVQSIGRYTFSNCQALTLLSMKSITPPVIDSTLSVKPLPHLTVSVPCGQKETYQAAHKWQQLNIQELPEHNLVLLTDDSEHGYVNLVGSDCSTDSITIAAVPATPYCFEQWSDGVKDSLRTIHLTQDTMLLALFSDKTPNMCGDSLYWEYNNGIITISGKGDMYDYTKTSVPWLQYKDSIVTIHIGDSVTSLGRYAFSECGQIEHVVIPDNVKVIGDYAFYNCTYLKSVVVSNGSIGTCAFAGCIMLNDITISEHVWCIGRSAFLRTKWYDAQSDGMVYAAHILYGYKGKIERDTTLVVREGTKSISANALDDDHIVCVTLPSSMEYISPNFSLSKGLSAIYMQSATPPNIPSKVFQTQQKTYTTVFVPCGALDAYRWESYWWELEHLEEANNYNIVLYSNFPQYGHGVVTHSRCSEYHATIEAMSIDERFQFVQWSDGSTDNPRRLFVTRDTALTALFAPIYSGQCGDNLQWEYKPDNRTLTITGSGDMYDYASISASPWRYFRDSIMTIDLPQSLTSIGRNAFYGCEYASLITIPDSVVWVGQYALSSTMWYDWQPEGPIYAGKALYAYTTAIQGDSIVIDEGTVSISPSVFYRYTTYPATAWKFSITIPSSMSVIGKQAFKDCYLTSITCFAEEPPTCEAQVFYGVSKRTPVYVPASAIDDYKAADQWKEFLNIYAIDSTNVATDIEEVTEMYLNKDNQGGYMAPRKILYQGQVLIVRDGQVFTITGMRVR